MALITPNHSHQPAPQFSYLGVPAPAGMGDWYESMSRTPIRDMPSNQPRCRLSTGETCRIVDRWSMAGMRKCSAVEDFARRGACPPLGRGGASQNPPCQFVVPSHNSGFSYLGVPAPAGDERLL